MSPYDVLMIALLVVAVIGMVINHRTGWLASWISRTSRSHDRDSSNSNRRLMDAKNGQVDLAQPSPTPQD